MMRVSSRTASDLTTEYQHETDTSRRAAAIGEDSNSDQGLRKLPLNKSKPRPKQAKKSEGVMGNIACLFHGLLKAGIYKDKVRECRSPTLETNASADSGIGELDPNEIQENQRFLDIMIDSAFRDQLQWKRHIISKRSSANLPCRVIVPMTTKVLAADTGPDGGVRCLDVEKIQDYNYCHDSQPENNKPIAGVRDWRKPHHKAFGLSQSLYDTDPETNRPVGEPNADAFAVVARENNAFLAVADGCGWGVNSFLAARTAVKSCIEHLSNHLDKAKTTQDIIETMLNSFKHAHERIVDSKGTITTLCAAVVCEVQGIDCYGLCVVNVGDSLAFVYRKDGCVQEVTTASHDSGKRDMKQAGGCIGPLVGDDPDLSNLTCSFTFLEEGDIVFLTSDGITDNFDPNVLKMTSPNDIDILLSPMKPSKSQEMLPDQEEKEVSLIPPTPRERSYSAPVEREAHVDMSKDLSCIYMKKVIQSESPCGEESSAKELCAKLMNFVLQNTREKRMFLEQKKDCKKEDFEKMRKTIPGKLDHATVVAYEVGHFPQPRPLKLTFHDKPIKKQQKQSDANGEEEKITNPSLDLNPDIRSLLGLFK